MAAPAPSASEPPAPVAPAAAARFARDWRAVAGTDAAPVLVALSGGGDSVALLLLARATFRDRCVAATVDHGLRPEAAAEAAWCAALCARIGVGHAILAAPFPARIEGSLNVSARARALRYALLDTEAERVGARRIATAHHADDQRETMMMRLARGAGVAGLAGVRATTGRVVRPLLGWRRADLAALVAEAGVVPVDDPSNVDDRYDRARLRKVLAGADWLDPLPLVRSARALGDAEDALAWSTARLAGERCAFGDGWATLAPNGLPFELCRRLAQACLSHVDADARPRGGALADLCRTLEEGREAMLGDVLVRVERAGDGACWRFVAAPPRRAHRSADRGLRSIAINRPALILGDER